MSWEDSDNWEIIEGDGVFVDTRALSRQIPNKLAQDRYQGYLRRLFGVSDRPEIFGLLIWKKSHTKTHSGVYINFKNRIPEIDQDDFEQ